MIAQTYAFLLDLGSGSVVHSTISCDLNVAHANVLQRLSQSTLAIRTTLLSVMPKLGVFTAYVKSHASGPLNLHALTPRALKAMLSTPMPSIDVR